MEQHFAYSKQDGPSRCEGKMPARKAALWEGCLRREVMERPLTAALAGSAKRGNSWGPSPAAPSSTAKSAGALHLSPTGTGSILHGLRYPDFLLCHFFFSPLSTPGLPDVRAQGRESLRR